MKIALLHSPYAQHGGEDQHVHQLSLLYKNQGVACVRFPEVADYSWSKLGAARVFRSVRRGAPHASLISFVERERPDLIHLHNPFPAIGVNGVLWLAEQKIPILQTVHNHRFFCTNGLARLRGQDCIVCLENTQGARLRPIVRNCNQEIARSTYYALAVANYREHCLDKISKFIAPSPYVADLLIRLRINRERIAQIFHPVTLPESISNAPVKAKTSYDLCYLGRFSQEKGVDELMLAVSTLPELRTIFIGSGPLLTSLQRQAKDLDHVSIELRADRAQALDLLGQSKALIIPSSCNETFSLVAAEGLLLRKKIFVSDRQGFSWLDSIDAPAIKFRAGDSASIANVLQTHLVKKNIVNESASYEEGQADWERYEVLFSEKHYIEKFFEAVESIK